jgi:sigma-B regulation protein RsbU (phosphoserine phosphatase)
MKISSRTVTRIATLVAIICWIGLVFSSETILFSTRNNITPEISVDLPGYLFSIYIFALFIFYKFKIEKAESINFVDLLWKVFVTGLIITIVSLSFQLLLRLLGESSLASNVLFLNFIYLSNLGLVSAYLVSTFIVWKRLIIYQRSKFLLRSWQVFEYAMLLSLLYMALPIAELRIIDRYYWGFLVLLGIFLSANMKWVAYLNFKQKWKSILLILLAMFYLVYFTFILYSYSNQLNNITAGQFLNVQENVFITSILTFIFTYALFSLLVILFNLPTSSVFEQKLEEVVNFQRLSQSIQTEQSETRVYEILLESVVSTVFADASWIEIYGKKGEEDTFYMYQISRREIDAIKNYVDKNNIKGIFDSGTDKSRNLGLIKGTRFRSILTQPIIVKGEMLGMLVVLKDVSDGFNKEMSKIVGTFTNQAGISIENFRLLSEALRNERYKEELKIAQRVQQSLLPDVLQHDNDYDIISFTDAADEVGGDYYDTYRINDHRIALIISDVSGKGTSAAFHMSQMKGVFQSLAQMDLSPSEFVVRANDALSRCLDKTSFITTSFFVIDSREKRVEFTRAGHCPTLYFNNAEKKAHYFRNKGLGLGILRNNGYDKYVHTNHFHYNPGDIMLLYTDGITEAKNAKGEEFGYDRLQLTLERNHENELELILDNLIEELYAFTGSKSINDDYTMIIVKFK